MVNRIDPNSSRISETQPIRPTAKPVQPARVEGTRPESDEVSLSAEALERLKAQSETSETQAASPVSDVPAGESPERTAKISALKKQIETGTYAISDQALVDKLLKSKLSDK